jgi:hypothetical protein
MQLSTLEKKGFWVYRKHDRYYRAVTSNCRPAISPPAERNLRPGHVAVRWLDNDEESYMELLKSYVVNVICGLTARGVPDVRRTKGTARKYSNSTQHVSCSAISSNLRIAANTDTVLTVQPPGMNPWCQSKDRRMDTRPFSFCFFWRKT